MYVHIYRYMLHAVKTSVCGVCHYRQPSVYNSVHESHKAHTPHNAVTASTSTRPWCVGDGDASRARVSPSQRHAHPRLVCMCVYVGCLRRHVECGLVGVWRVRAWVRSSVVCVRASATHTLIKGTEMLHNAQWLTRSRMSAHHTVVSMPSPPITKTRSPWTTADMKQHGLGSDGPLCQVCVPPSNT